MNTISVQEAISENIDDIFHLFTFADQMHREAHPEIFRSLQNIDKIKAYYQTCIKNADSTIFVAKRSDKLIGAIICRLETTSDIPILVPRKFVCVENIVVAKTHRKHGVGSALFNAVQVWSAQYGATAIELTAWDFNRGAIAFYKKLGFTTLRHRLVKEIK